MIKQSISPFIRPQKQKQLLMRVILITYLNQTIIQQIYYIKHTNIIWKWFVLDS